MSAEDERIGADFTEHGIVQDQEIYPQLNEIRRGSSMYCKRPKRVRELPERKYKHGVINFGMISYDTTTMQAVGEEYSEASSSAEDECGIRQKHKIVVNSNAKSLTNLNKQCLSKDVGDIVDQDVGCSNTTESLHQRNIVNKTKLKKHINFSDIDVKIL